MLYPREFPIAVKTQRLGIEGRQSIAESQYTFEKQIIHTSSRWVLEWTWPVMTLERAEEVSAWLASLRGQIGSFRYRPRQAYQSSLTTITVATTAFAYNGALQAQGWAAGAQSTLRAGQFFQLGTQLLQITEAAAFADASGKVLIEFEPQLRINYPVNTPINFVNPAGVFCLTDSAAQAYTLTPDYAPEFGTIVAREQI